jgi:hypothetical protein
MRTRELHRIAIAGLVAVLAMASPGFGQERLEGQVTSTTMTACEFKPGTCEGSLVLDTKPSGTPGQVTIKVPKGTRIKKGQDDVFLPSVRGATVVITYVVERGEKVAKSIDVKP